MTFLLFMDTRNLAPTATPAPHAPRLPGDLAIWFFILAELLAFGLLFTVYAFARARNVDLFNDSQLGLNRMAGAINTVFLISASWFVARAVQETRQDRIAPAARRLGAGILCGGGFLIVKVFEYSEKFSAGISLSTNNFYMFYLSLTFFHFMHVVLGMVILSAVFLKLRRGAYGSHDCNGLESGAVYWHMVDLVWIVLFPLVYVMR
jgi:nitric oxide reductase NorE protein